MREPMDVAIQKAAEAISQADAMLIGAGAGMGVDSGLPDFRGGEGFWRAYPPYKTMGLDFHTLADPRWFREDPALAWGFYGHRLELYRSTEPHEGFAILREWAERMPMGAFVYTSNVDGQFQRAAFDPDRIIEVHGAIDHMQCVGDCGIGIFPAEGFAVAVDHKTMRARNPLPKCPRCGAMARPNILMFGDRDWDSSNTSDQRARLHSWLNALRGRKVVMVECGAGTAIPTVRLSCEDLAGQLKGTLIRINPREFEVPPGHINLPLGALDGLLEIQKRLEPER